MVRRLNVRLERTEAMHVTRVAVHHEKLVYVIVADKKLKYPNGRSKIAYIGTTMNGVDRVAQSAASRTDQILGLRGVNSFTVRIVTCRVRQRVSTWKILERALLLAFKDKFGQQPVCNSHGKNYEWRDETEYFASARLAAIIDDLS